MFLRKAVSSEVTLVAAHWGGNAPAEPPRTEPPVRGRPGAERRLIFPLWGRSLFELLALVEDVVAFISLSAP